MAVFRLNNEIVFPCKLILPESGLNIPDIALKRVDFPLPFFPQIPNIWPFGTSKDTPFKALNIFPLPLPFTPLRLRENLFISL